MQCAYTLYKNCICSNMPLFYKLKERLPWDFAFFPLLSPPSVFTPLASQVLMSSWHLLMEVQSLSLIPLLKLTLSPNTWTFKMISLFPWSSLPFKNPSPFILLDLKHQYEINSVHLLHNNKWQNCNPSLDVCIFKESFLQLFFRNYVTTKD